MLRSFFSDNNANVVDQDTQFAISPNLHFPLITLENVSHKGIKLNPTATIMKYQLSWTHLLLPSHPPNDQIQDFRISDQYLI